MGKTTRTIATSMKASKGRTPAPKNSIASYFGSRYSILGEMGSDDKVDKVVKKKKDDGKKKTDKGKTAQGKIDKTKETQNQGKQTSADKDKSVEKEKNSRRDSISSTETDKNDNDEELAGFLGGLQKDLDLTEDQKTIFDRNIIGLIKVIVKQVLIGSKELRDQFREKRTGKENYDSQSKDKSASMILSGVQQIFELTGHLEGEFWQDKIVRFFNMKGYCVPILDVFPIFQEDGKVQVCMIRFASRFVKILASKIIYRTKMATATRDLVKDVYSRDAFPKDQVARVKQLNAIAAPLKKDKVINAFRITNFGDNIPVLEMRKIINGVGTWKRYNEDPSPDKDIPMTERKRRASSESIKSNDTWRDHSGRIIGEEPKSQRPSRKRLDFQGNTTTTKAAVHSRIGEGDDADDDDIHEIL